MIIPVFAFSGQEIISEHNYSIYKGKILFGKSSYILSKIGSNYFFEIKSSTDGIFKMKKDERMESSNYIIDNNKVNPLTYLYSRKKKDKEEELITNFKANSTATTIVNGDAKEHPDTKNSFDRLSVQIAFQEDMKKGVFESKYNIIDKGRSRVYIYTIHSDDIIDTIFGETNTIVIRRTIENNKRSTLTWYAVDHDYIPVKIEQYRKDALKFTVYLEEVVK
tara:strand:+ start:225 stop:887 length:663 start_codon:yes stop_codon:yes gene_type:complete